MTNFHHFILTSLAAASVAAGTAASAEVLQARSECIGGYWHVRTYDITDGVEKLVQDDKTDQPCGAMATSVSEMRAWSGERYRFEPKYEMRPMLGYQYSHPEPQREMRMPLRYSF